MKYYTWKLKWELNPESNQIEGTDPVGLGLVSNAMPLFFDKPINDQDAKVYVIVNSGNLEVSQLSKWEVTEVTPTVFLGAAQQIDANASLDASGLIVWSIGEPSERP